MAIEIINGKVNIDGKELKEKGSKLKMSESEEKRLIDLGFAKAIDEEEEIEVIDGDKDSDKDKGKKDGKKDNN